jgi:hypothetical protein
VIEGCPGCDMLLTIADLDLRSRIACPTLVSGFQQEKRARQNFGNVLYRPGYFRHCDNGVLEVEKRR